MAQYKVPQNVEAEDKLLGPFSFRQFIYGMIAIGAGFLVYFLGTIAIPLAFIPVPICVFFLVLALPLRKDQPMETYLAAVVKFWFKPHTRLWDAQGMDNMIEISVPVVEEPPKTKDFSGEEAVRRLSFLSEVTDSQGWSLRGNNNNLNEDFMMSANNATDILDNSDSLSQQFDNRLHRSETQMRQDLVASIQSASANAPVPVSAPVVEPISTDSGENSFVEPQPINPAQSVFDPSPAPQSEFAEPFAPETPSEPEQIDEPVSESSPEPTEFMVIFDVDGGIPEIPSVTVKDGETLGDNFPEDPAKKGYVFDGWFDGAAKYTATTEITGDTALTAEWKVESSPASKESEKSAIIESDNVKSADQDVEVEINLDDPDNSNKEVEIDL